MNGELKELMEVVKGAAVEEVEQRTKMEECRKRIEELENKVGNMEFDVKIEKEKMLCLEVAMEKMKTNLLIIIAGMAASLLINFILYMVCH